MKRINPRLKVYTRLTVQLDDQSQVHQLSSDPVQSHDILAVQPATEKLFQQACKTLDVDIISLDMTERLPFYLKFPTVNAAIERGIRFGIVYSSAIRDSSQRKNLISTALDLVVFAKGRNIIISSGAVNELDFRGPYDIINLGLLFNLRRNNQKQPSQRTVGMFYSMLMLEKAQKDQLFQENYWRNQLSCSLIKKKETLVRVVLAKARSKMLMTMTRVTIMNQKKRNQKLDDEFTSYIA